MKVQVIVLGLSPTAKYVAREASLAGASCYGFDTKMGSAYHSRYFRQTRVVTEQELLRRLENDLLPTGNTYYVCPTSDEWVKFLAEQSLFQHERLKVSPGLRDGSFARLADKAKLEQLARELGLHYPRSAIFTPAGELPDLAGWRFPLFCKPADRAGLAHVMQGKKGWIVEQANELGQFRTIAGLADTELLIQEIIPGPEANIRVLGMVSRGGEETNDEIWTGVKARQYPPGFGSASLLVKEHDAQLIDIGRQLASATGYRGFFALEVKYSSADHRCYLIEVNTRPSLWFSATTTSRYQLVLRWINSFGLVSLPLAPPLVDKPVVWKYLYKDKVAKARASSNAAAQPYEDTPGALAAYAVWDPNDPLPFLHDLWNGASKLVIRKLKP